MIKIFKQLEFCRTDGNSNSTWIEEAHKNLNAASLPLNFDFIYLNKINCIRWTLSIEERGAAVILSMNVLN